ncbi:hypothetical protein BU16DRAFT_597614 [Lophium mytilinum]|uniref:Uncharacterized protein n=1 Tax=Lophium mytilinum TaxID=390894 RepID=A0A6A6QC98_9PEZI|nr:hypothetical protein BU16DRAFT_597614 [Lophium mytilinum]
MRSSCILLCFVLVFGQPISVTASAIPRASSSTSPAPSKSPIPLPPAIPKSLPISSSPPDVFGISQVSGFYGPGTWGAWVVTGAASWYRLVVDRRHVLDPNTWVFILAINWAAVDLIRHVHSLKVLKNSGDDSSDKHLGSIGAAFTIVFWGVMHEIMQICGIQLIDEGSKRPRKVREGRVLTLVSGMVLPLTTLSFMLFTFGFFNDTALPDSVWSNIPALYGLYSGSDLTAEEFKNHGDRVLHACLIGPWALFVGAGVYLQMWWNNASERTKIKFKEAYQPYKRLGSFFTTALLMWSTLSMLVLLVMIFVDEDKVWIIFMGSPFLVLQYFLFLQCLALFLLPLLSLIQLLVGDHSRSCFFMPCAPQPITDWDQAFSLFVAVSLLIGTEIGPNVIRRWERKKEEQRAFEEEMRQKIELEMGQRTNAVGQN